MNFNYLFLISELFFSKLPVLKGSNRESINRTPAGLYVYSCGMVPAVHFSNNVPKLAILQDLGSYNSIIAMSITQNCLELSY